MIGESSKADSSPLKRFGMTVVIWLVSVSENQEIGCEAGLEGRPYTLLYRYRH